MNRYEYNGPVMEFDKYIDRDWSGTTYAPTAKKAKSNLAYQYKIKHNKCANAKISLPEDVVEVR